ncbi:2068_t:CDS:2 [Funneliformis geosporum]|uniref:2068_t:CDS:1 n=1 Tax=Funneliformis geosporum TaxID=1117311 RepID=A0A9W4X1A6_9GLOM|nr:2068_t:CDS:2 [Funneliformis geosporum]
MTEKFHVGARPALDKNSQTDKTEQTLEVVSEVSLPATEIPKKNSQKRRLK